MPLYVSLCDMFVVIAPSAVHVDLNSACDFETYLARGWCRAEIMTKVLNTGLRNLFLCESRTGELDPVTEDTLQRIDLRVFEGSFSCCDAKHENRKMCDRELLRTPILGVYFAFLDAQCVLPREEGKEEDQSFQWARHFIDHNIDRMFPVAIDFEKRTPGSSDATIERRELFGVLLKLIAGRDPRRFRAPAVAAPLPCDISAAAPVQSQTLSVDDVGVELSDTPARDVGLIDQSFPSHLQDRCADEVAMKLVLCEVRQESGDPLYKSMLEDWDVCEVTTNVAASVACCGLRQTGRDTRNVMCFRMDC